MIEFGKLTDLINNATALTTNGAVAFAMGKNENQFYTLELNRRRQLFFQGIDAKGKLLSSIGGPYTLFTLRQKEGARPVNRANLIDLFDTGEFYSTFNIILERDGFLIIADTKKEDGDLQERWGNDIVGLTEESQEMLGGRIQPDVLEYTKGELLK